MRRHEDHEALGLPDLSPGLENHATWLIEPTDLAGRVVLVARQIMILPGDRAMLFAVANDGGLRGHGLSGRLRGGRIDLTTGRRELPFDRLDHAVHDVLDVDGRRCRSRDRDGLRDDLRRSGRVCGRGWRGRVRRRGRVPHRIDCRARDNAEKERDDDRETELVHATSLNLAASRDDGGANDDVDHDDCHQESHLDGPDRPRVDAEVPKDQDKPYYGERSADGSPVDGVEPPSFRGEGRQGGHKGANQEGHKPQTRETED